MSGLLPAPPQALPPVLTNSRRSPGSAVGQNSFASVLTGSGNGSGDSQAPFSVARYATQKTRLPDRSEAKNNVRPSGDSIGQPSLTAELTVIRAASTLIAGPHAPKCCAKASAVTDSASKTTTAATRALSAPPRHRPVTAAPALNRLLPRDMLLTSSNPSGLWDATVAGGGVDRYSGPPSPSRERRSPER